MARGKQPPSKQAANNNKTNSSSNRKQALPAAGATERLRVQQPNTLRAILTAAPIRSQIKRLELVEKLPLKLYEELAACLLVNDQGAEGSKSGSGMPSPGGGFPCLEVLSLSDSSCGDAALLTLLPALTHHTKLAVLDASGCCLSDAAGARVTSLLRVQAAAAAQDAWARTLRGNNSSSASASRRPSSANRASRTSFQHSRLLQRAEAGWQGDTSVLDPQDAATPGSAVTAAAAAALAEELLLCSDRPGLQVVDLSNNQLTSVTLDALACALADEHSCISRLVLSHNPGLPAAPQAAAVLLAAQQADPAAHRFTVELLQAPAPAAAAAAILAGCWPSTGTRSARSTRTQDGQAGGSSRTVPVSRTRVLMPRPSTSSSGAGGSSSSGGGSSGRRGAASVVSAPTDASVQLYAGVFVWDGLSAGQCQQYAQPLSSSHHRKQRQQQQVKRALGKATRQQQGTDVRAAGEAPAASAAAGEVQASDRMHCLAGVADSASGAAAAAAASSAAVADQLRTYTAANTASIRSREAADAAAAAASFDTNAATAVASQESDDDSWVDGLAAADEGLQEPQEHHRHRQQRRLQQLEEEAAEAQSSQQQQQRLLQELLFGLDLQGSAELQQQSQQQQQQQQQQQDAPAGDNRRVAWACDSTDQQQQEQVLQPAIVLLHSVAELERQLRQYQQWHKRRQQQQGVHAVAGSRGSSPSSKQHRKMKNPTRQRQQQQQPEQHQHPEYTPNQSPEAQPAQPASGRKQRKQAPSSPPKQAHQQRQGSPDKQQAHHDQSPGPHAKAGRRVSSRQQQRQRHQQQLQAQLSVQPGGGAPGDAGAGGAGAAGHAGGCAAGVETGLPADLLELAQTLCVLTDTVAQLECLVYSRAD